MRDAKASNTKAAALHAELQGLLEELGELREEEAELQAELQALRDRMAHLEIKRSDLYQRIEEECVERGLHIEAAIAARAQGK